MLVLLCTDFNNILLFFFGFECISKTHALKANQVTQSVTVDACMNAWLTITNVKD